VRVAAQAPFGAAGMWNRVTHPVLEGSGRLPGPRHGNDSAPGAEAQRAAPPFARESLHGRPAPQRPDPEESRSAAPSSLNEGFNPARVSTVVPGAGCSSRSNKRSRSSGKEDSRARNSRARWRWSPSPVRTPRTGRAAAASTPYSRDHLRREPCGTRLGQCSIRPGEAGPSPRTASEAHRHPGHCADPAGHTSWGRRSSPLAR